MRGQQGLTVQHWERVAVQKDTVSNLALRREGRRWFLFVFWKILSVGKTEKARGTVEQPMQRPVYENMVGTFTKLQLDKFCC